MSERWNRVGLNIIKTRNTPTARRVTSRFMVHAQVPFSSDENALELLPGGARHGPTDEVQTQQLTAGIDNMKSNVQKVPRLSAGVALSLILFAGVVMAQTPSPSPSPKKPAETPSTSSQAGEGAGDYTVTGSIEVGYRGLRVDGDLNKYQSDLNYKAGPRQIGRAHV